MAKQTCNQKLKIVGVHLVSKQQIETVDAMMLFNECERVGEGMFNKVHLLHSLDDINCRTQWRGYHADGYCFNVTAEPVETDEATMVNESEINGIEYHYNDEVFEGFKTMSAKEMYNIIKKLRS